MVGRSGMTLAMLFFAVQVSFFDKTEIILSSEERVVTYTDHAGTTL